MFIQALVIPIDPSEPLRLQSIDRQNLRAYSQLIDGGTLEVVHMDRPDASLYLDEEGKRKGLVFNVQATALAWVHNSVLRARQDHIMGPAFLVGPVNARGDDETVPQDLVDLLLHTEQYRVQVQHDEGPGWRNNEQVFTEWYDAYCYAIDLALKWKAIEEVRVVPELPVELRRTWFSIGRQNTWIRNAYDPPFTIESFTGCYSLEELEERIGHGNWAVGVSFYYRDLCLINQIEGGDEWLTIRHGISFESITFGPSIKDGSFPKLIHRLLTATEEQCKGLTY